MPSQRPEDPAPSLSPRTFILWLAGMAVFAFGTAFYAAELGVTWLAGAPSKAQFSASFQEKDPAAVPAVTPQIILTETGFQGLAIPAPAPAAPGDAPNPFPASAANFIMPLGGVAKAQTIFCRESGDYLVYQSDRYGFHNDDRVWDAADVDLAVVGDSFAQGACVPSDKNIPALLAKRFPHTINLGSFGNGPLADLATIVEYLPAKKPKRVLWFYVTNDIGTDLGIERGSSILKRYLLPGFSQNLAQRQGEVDAVLRPFLAKRLAEELSREPVLGARILDHLAGSGLRQFLKIRMEHALRPRPPAEPAVADYDRAAALQYRAFDEALVAARRTVESWGGQLTVVFIPDSRMFGGFEARSGAETPEVYLARLRMRLDRINIDTIDLRAAFADLKSPLSYYTPLGGFYGHFNEKGYAFAAEHILEQLAPKTAMLP